MAAVGVKVGGIGGSSGTGAQQGPNGTQFFDTPEEASAAVAAGADPSKVYYTDQYGNKQSLNNVAPPEGLDDAAKKAGASTYTYTDANGVTLSSPVSGGDGYHGGGGNYNGSSGTLDKPNTSTAYTNPGESSEHNAGVGPGASIDDAWNAAKKGAKAIGNRLVGALNPGDAYRNLGTEEDRLSGEAKDLAAEQRGYFESGGDKSQGYLDRQQGTIDSVYGPGGRLAGPTNAQSTFNAYSPQLGNKSDVENRYQQQLSADHPGAAEQLYAERKAAGGLDPYSAMQLKMGLGANDASAAAAGNYNSGGRLAANALTTQGVLADAYHAMSDEAQQAQQDEQQREAYLSGLAQDSTNAFKGRLEQIGQLGNQADANNQARGNAQVQAQGQLSGAQAATQQDTTKQAGGSYQDVYGGGLGLEHAAAGNRAAGTIADNNLTGDLVKAAASYATTGSPYAPFQRGGSTPNPYAPAAGQQPTG